MTGSKVLAGLRYLNKFGLEAGMATVSRGAVLIQVDCGRKGSSHFREPGALGVGEIVAKLVACMYSSSP